MASRSSMPHSVQDRLPTISMQMRDPSRFATLPDALECKCGRLSRIARFDGGPAVSYDSGPPVTGSGDGGPPVTGDGARHAGDPTSRVSQ